MNYYFDNQDFGDDQQWYDGLSNLEDSEITDSVKIQEPINFGLSHIAGGHITPLNHHLSVNHFIGTCGTQ